MRSEESPETRGQSRTLKHTLTRLRDLWSFQERLLAIHPQPLAPEYEYSNHSHGIERVSLVHFRALRERADSPDWGT